MLRSLSKFPWQSLLALGAVLNVFSWGTAAWLFPRQEENVILHFSEGIGVDFVGEGAKIFALPTLGLIVLVLNAVLAFVLKKSEPALQWLLLFVIPLAQLIILASLIFLWRQNL